ncbi:MAG: S41 family peptidase [Acidobacteriota bacterium]|nr:S41 family peptidase [Acidobacteriota bacterium]
MNTQQPGPRQGRRPVTFRATATCLVIVSAFLLSTPVRSESPPRGIAPSLGPGSPATADEFPSHAKIGKRTVEEWRELIDETWGPGLPANEQVAIFDAAWDNLDQDYGAYMNLEVDMQALHRRYRQEIRVGVSRGRFAAIMNHLSLAMKDAHTAIMSYSINWQGRINFDTPLFVVGAWVDNSTFGAALTPLPDGSLLVYRVLPNHNLGLQPGDLVLGYDGVPWKDLYQQLVAAELPIQLRWVWGSTDDSMEHCMLMSAGMNWHLFDTIDIQKYGSGEVVSLSTTLLVGQQGTIWGNEQLSVPGVEMPDFINEDYITWGVIDGTQIGYIYVAGWHWQDEYLISEQWHEALDELMHHHETIGLIVDFRLNYGGYMLEAHDGYRLLFNERVSAVSFDLRGDPDDHLDMVPHPTFNAARFTIPGNSTTYYDKPIAVLFGPGSVSNGDWESLRMGFHPMVRTFGKPTNGAFTLSDTPNLGDDWFFTKATGSGYLVEGHQYLAHTGVQPDQEVWLERDDVAAGRDTVVEAAMSWIESRWPRRPTGRLSP